MPLDIAMLFSAVFFYAKVPDHLPHMPKFEIVKLWKIAEHLIFVGDNLAVSGEANLET